MNGNLFTQDELDLVTNPNLTHTQVSKRTGRSTSTICLKRKELNVTVIVDGRRRTKTQTAA